MRPTPASPLPRLATLTAAAALAALAACARAPRAPAGPTTGDAVLRAMRERYDGEWYRTLAYTQRVTQPQPGGADRSTTWYAAMAVPGRLRIETDPAGRSGRIFVRDSQFLIVNNQLRRGVPGHNVRLVLGFDVYGQPPARTAEVLRELGFPPGPVREEAWQGRPAYVVGARAGDLHSHQYWIDRERLVVVRVLQPLVGDTARTFEVRFNRYRPLDDAWFADEIEELVDGQRTLLETYDDVRVDPRLDDALFDPRRWAAASVRRLP